VNQFDRFKEAVLKDVPEFIGSVELYNPSSDCYCTAGLALKNIGYDVKGAIVKARNAGDSTAIELYTDFKKEFGLNCASIGMTSDDKVRSSENVVKIPRSIGNDYSGYYKKAPALEVINGVFESFERWPEHYLEIIASAVPLDG
jgi:hypothetical protein